MEDLRRGLEDRDEARETDEEELLVDGKGAVGK